MGFVPAIHAAPFLRARAITDLSGAYFAGSFGLQRIVSDVFS
jgi:hypothetical protein